MDDRNKHIRQLEQRVENLESNIKQMLPSRRDALKLGGAAIIGGAAMSGTASAGSSQVGTIGTNTDRVDINAEDIDVSDTITTQDLTVNGTATGVGRYTLDQTVNSSGSDVTVNLNTNSNIVKVVFKSLNNNTGGSDAYFIKLQINGVTTSTYTNYRTESGRNINEDAFRFALVEQFAAGTVRGELDLHASSGGVNYNVGNAAGYRIDATETPTDDLPLYGGAKDAAGPISSLRFFGTEGVDIEADVFVTSFNV